MRVRVALGGLSAVAVVAAGVWGGSGTPARAGEPRAADDKAPSFKNDVMPILNDKCVNCHNNQKAKGRVNLETYTGVMRTIQAGSADKSRLVKSLLGSGAKQMPPKKKLPTGDVDVIKAWIAAGAKND